MALSTSPGTTAEGFDAISIGTRREGFRDFDVTFTYR